MFAGFTGSCREKNQTACRHGRAGRSTGRQAGICCGTFLFQSSWPPSSSSVGRVTAAPSARYHLPMPRGRARDVPFTCLRRLQLFCADPCATHLCAVLFFSLLWSCDLAFRLVRCCCLHMAFFVWPWRMSVCLGLNCDTHSSRGGPILNPTPPSHLLIK